MKRVRILVSTATVFAVMIGAPICIYWASVSYGFVRPSSKNHNIPSAVELGSVTAYGPGCDLFWCAGGTVYEIQPETAEQIRERGLQFLRPLTELPRGLTLDKGWKEYPPVAGRLSREHNRPDNCPSWLYKGPPNIGNFEEFEEAMGREHHYVGTRSGDEPVIIILPKAELLYVGWFD